MNYPNRKKKANRMHTYSELLVSHFETNIREESPRLKEPVRKQNVAFCPPQRAVSTISRAKGGSQNKMQILPRLLYQSSSNMNSNRVCQQLILIGKKPDHSREKSEDSSEGSQSIFTKLPKSYQFSESIESKNKHIIQRRLHKTETEETPRRVFSPKRKMKKQMEFWQLQARISMIDNPYYQNDFVPESDNNPETLRDNRLHNVFHVRKHSCTPAYKNSLNSSQTKKSVKCLKKERTLHTLLRDYLKNGTRKPDVSEIQKLLKCGGKAAEKKKEISRQDPRQALNTIRTNFRVPTSVERRQRIMRYGRWYLNPKDFKNLLP